MTTPYRGPNDVEIDKGGVKKYLSETHYELSLLSVMEMFEVKNFLDCHLDAVTQVFKHGFFEGWNQCHQEWMCYEEELSSNE